MKNLKKLSEELNMVLTYDDLDEYQKIERAIEISKKINQELFNKEEEPLSVKITYAIDLLHDNGYAINTVFTTEDVISLYKTLSENQAMQVIAYIENNFDAGIGVNLHTIEDAVNDLFPNTK